MIQDKYKFTDKELIEEYKQEPKLGRLSVKFGVPNITIWRRAQKLELKFVNGGNSGKFELEDILDGKHPQYPTVKLKNRLLKDGFVENKCSECGVEEWNGKPLNIQLDHIDGDSHNHKFDNLRMLCPNCHSQTSTFCGRNK
jgi:hypothetical protein